LGAYDYGFYKQGMDGRNDSRLGAALIAIKEELAYNGFGKNLVMNAVFGDAAANRLEEFQSFKGLTADRQAGPSTLKELFRKRVEQTEDTFDLWRGTLGRQIWLESNFDPVAKGVADPDDTGIAQINLRIHSTITETQAFDPNFSFRWAAQYITDAASRIVKEIDVMKAARAAYNVGTEYAEEWLLAGFPSSGGPDLGGEDSFTRATNYIALIDKQVW
jgi:hypothetical protein